MHSVGAEWMRLRTPLIRAAAYSGWERRAEPHNSQSDRTPGAQVDAVLALETLCWLLTQTSRIKCNMATCDKYRTFSDLDSLERLPRADIGDQIRACPQICAILTGDGNPDIFGIGVSTLNCNLFANVKLTRNLQTALHILYPVLHSSHHLRPMPLYRRPCSISPSWTFPA